MLEKSYAQANIWSRGPLELTADITLPQTKKPALQLTYKVSWASPDLWRAEWSGGGYSRITIVNHGKMFRFSSAAVPPLPIMEYERGMGALVGHGFIGPAAGIPDLSGVKIDVSSEKFGKSRVECFRVKNTSGHLCLDAASAQASAWDTGESRFEYSDYAAARSASFPMTIRQVADKQTLMDSHIRVAEPTSFSETLFTAPTNATVTDYPSCSGDSRTLRGSTLEKKVMPVYPQNAKAAHHQGTVLLYAAVGKDGSVETLKPVVATWPELETSAMNAVKAWQYSP
ncbi:MAG TPA: energy transducer TonB, partial [Terriglobales bacterium]